MPFIRSVLALALAAAMLPSAAAAQERGTVTGTVSDAATRQPVVGAQVTIAGTQLGSVTDQQGRFLIPNVPPGEREVRTSLIGYAQATESVTVVAGEVVTVEFLIRESAVALDALVVTATGEMQRVRERGNVVAQIPVAQMELAPINSMSDLLQGRSAGVVVQHSSGTTGAGARVRVRGSASASLGNQPLLIIDGVRINESPESFSIMLGGQSPSRLDDLNPDEIESIEVLKGPAAAALYGTAAATGVIQVTTRRGRAGPARWTAYTELGMLHERTEWPGNYLMLGDWNGEIAACWTFQQAAGACTPVEMQSWNPLMDRREGHGVSNPALGPASPFRDGNRQKYGFNVSGGGEATTYFFSTELEEEQGIFRNNSLDRVSLRANVRSQLRDNVDLTVNTGWISSDIRMPWSDNSTSGSIGNALTGEAQDDPVRRGYQDQGPDQVASVDSRQGLGRFIGSATANYRPLPWLTLLGTAGLDVVNRSDTETVPANTIFTGSFPEGRRISNQVDVRNYTATLGATASHSLSPSLQSTTSLGAQYHQETFHGTFAQAWQLLEGTGSLAGAGARPAVNEINSDVIMVGAYVQQQLALHDRVFLTGALRGDDNSAFGADFGLIWYPSLSASWVLNEEPWFPEIGSLSTLRLRSAVGRSGLRPGFRQALTYYVPVGTTVEARDQPGFTVGGVGDPGLRPEISTEIEGGVDLGFFDGRVGLEFTGFYKRSEDALIARRLAPSLGLAQTRFENIGVVRNSGIEVEANATIINRPNARWNATMNFGTTHNELVEMDGDPIIFGLASGQRHQVGFPLGGYWMFPYTFEDHDGNGLLRLQDVVLADTMEYAGTPFPTRNLTFGSNVTLWNVVRISGLLEHQGGHTLWSGSHEWQCVFLLCRDLNDPDAPLEAQARGIATAAYGSWWGYLEDASFTKLRELSITFMAPQQMAQRWRLDGLSLTLSGRNLATWTNYTGTDPEVNFAGQSNFSTAEFQSQPPVRHWTARVNVNF